MAILKRSGKSRRDIHKPEVVTGEFELHYEDVINKNRYALVALLASGLVLLAAFVPSAVYESMADTDRASIEVESGIITQPQLVDLVEGDPTASEGSFIEFKIVPDGSSPESYQGQN